MKKDRAIALRVNGDVWDKFKELAKTQRTNATELICQFMENSLGIVPIQSIDGLENRIDDMPIQSPSNVLVERIDGLENRIGVLESRAIAPVQNIRRGIYQVEPLAIEPNKSVPRSSNGGINIVELSKRFGCKDVQICRWIRGSISNSPARIAFDRWCEANPAAHRELIDRFVSS